MNKKLTIATHKGLFHADEVAAVAILLTEADPFDRGSRLKVRRVNIEDYADTEFYYVLDTGRVYDPKQNLIDHHQFDPKNPQPELVRPNGIPYATAGLVWKKLGESVIEKLHGYTENIEEIVKRVDQALIEQIDANDADSSFYAEASASENNVRIYTLSRVISLFNSDDIHDDIEQHEAFMNAVSFFQHVLKKQIKQAIKYVEAKNKFSEIIEKISEEVIFLPEFLPWKEIIREDYPNVRFLITNSSHKRGEFSLLAVPTNPAKRSLLLPIERPAWFEGFIHAGKFVAGVKTKEEALSLANFNLKK